MKVESGGSNISYWPQQRKRINVPVKTFLKLLWLTDWKTGGSEERSRETRGKESASSRVSRGICRSVG